MANVFTTIPSNFFSPLASPNREHYAALLVIFYRLFQENAGGIERNTAVSRFAEYAAGNLDKFASESNEGEIPEDSKPAGMVDEDSEDLETDSLSAETMEEAEIPGSEGRTDTARDAASRFLRILLQAGWMSEEVQSDYSRNLNITPYAKPFYEALARVDEGLRTEYESHVVAVYSLLCGDAAEENGHYAVLNAHSATIALIDSLKVLSQSIKGHYERFFETSANAEVKDLLHLHYDLYANDILDGPYKRLKTSDNLSRYRPRILKRVHEFLADEKWLASSAGKLSRMGSATVEASRLRLRSMLEEIRDTLKVVDPLLEDIDRRNMLYSRASIERIKALLESDATVAGRIAEIARSMHSVPQLHSSLSHHLYRIRAIAPESRYRRWLREKIDPKALPRLKSDPAETARAEAELRLRIARQLGPEKIAAWLDERGGRERTLNSGELAVDMDNFIRLLYAVVYADSKQRRFPYDVAEGREERVETGIYNIPDLEFRRKR